LVAPGRYGGSRERKKTASYAKCGKVVAVAAINPE
jgi:hypothetical protein